MGRVFREYERRKAAEGLLDFEDLLERTVRLLEEDEEARAGMHERWRAFTVDEYQDVNLLQQALLDLWLGQRDELCAVGDDYQAIYGFTGASAGWLLALPQRFPHARVVQLERSYRSTSQVLELANRLVPRLAGSAKTLAPTLPDGPEPVVGPGLDVAAHVRQLHADGLPLEEMAVLVRTNARTSEFEEAFHDAAIPFQGASMLARDAARQLLKALHGRRGPAAEIVRQLAVRQGLLSEVPDKLGEREQTRCPRTSSSTTGRSRSSPRGRRARSPSSRRCRESGRRSSSATGPSCSRGSPTSPPEPSGVQGGQQQPQHLGRIATHARRRGVPLAQLERARVGQWLQTSPSDQLLVHTPEPAAVRRVDRHAECGRLAVHRPARRDDECGERDQAP